MKAKPAVLVIDDNENSLLLDKDMLEIAGFEVFEAANASGGIALARQERPDIIIMDVQLPDMSGYDAARVLRQDHETLDIPIVFVTASVTSEDKDKIAGIPNSTFIRKPINTRTFAEDIRLLIK